MGQAAFQKAGDSMDNKVSRECRRGAFEQRPMTWTERVEDYFLKRRTTGATPEDCMWAFGVIEGFHLQNTIKPRISELLNAKVLVETGEKRETRASRENSKAGKKHKKTYAAVLVHRDWAGRDYLQHTDQPALFGDGELGRSSAARHFPG